MGYLALRSSSSFDDIVSEVSSTRTYSEQEQIYKGFTRLIGLPGEILVAKKELAAKPKDPVHEPMGARQLTLSNLLAKSTERSCASIPVFDLTSCEAISTILLEVKVEY